MPAIILFAYKLMSTRSYLSDDAADETQQRRVQAGETVRGAQHPGGGGKSQWYHQYDRRFDSLLALRPQPAPFGVELAEPWNPRFGENRLSLVFSNTAEAPLKLKFRCRFHERSSSTEPTSAQPTWQRGDRVQRQVIDDRLIELIAASARASSWHSIFLVRAAD